MSRKGGVTAAWLAEGNFEVEVAGVRHAVDLQFEGFYDPKNERMRTLGRALAWPGACRSRRSPVVPGSQSERTGRLSLWWPRCRSPRPRRSTISSASALVAISGGREAIARSCPPRTKSRSSKHALLRRLLTLGYSAKGLRDCGIGVKLDAEEESLAADLADERVTPKPLAQALHEVRSNPCRVRGQILRSSMSRFALAIAARRMAGPGKAMREHRVRALVRVQHVRHFGRQEASGHWEVAAGEALGDGDEVGFELEGLARKPVSGPAKSRDHLVGDHEDVVAVENALHLAEVAGRRHKYAARPGNRLRDKGRDRVRALGLDQLRELIDEVLRELGRRRNIFWAAVIVRRERMQDPGDRQIERLVHHRQTAETGSRHRRAVVARLDAR